MMINTQKNTYVLTLVSNLFPFFISSIETPQTILDWINSGGIIGLLAFIILGGSKRWWVFGWQYKDLQERYNKVEESNTMWMQVALRGVNVTEQIVKTVSESNGAEKES